nr:AI-2E family transporter [Conexibacter arvalis]
MVVAGTAVALWLLWRLRQPLAWLAIAAFLAIVASGPVELLERRLPRPLAVACVYVALFAVPVGLALLIWPTVADQAQALVRRLPEWIDEAGAWLDENETFRRLDDEYQVVDRVREAAADLPARVDDLLSLASTAVAGIVSAAVSAVVVLVLAIAMTLHGDRLAAAGLRLVPDEHRARAERTARDVRGATLAYVRAQLSIALIAAVSGYVVMTALGIPFREPLAVVIAFGSLLPVIGSLLWGVTIGLVTVFVGFPATTLLWALWAVAYPQLENNVLQPLIQRRAVDVAPIVVLFAVLCGGTLFGAIGVLLAIPTAAALQIALREWLAWRAEERAAATARAAPLRRRTAG